MLAEMLPPEYTGSGMQAVFLGKALVRRRVRTIALCSNPGGKSGWDESWGFPIFRLHTSSKERLRGLEFAIRSMIWLMRNRAEYDILHIHGACWGGLGGSVVARMLGKKTLYKITLPGEDDPEALFRSRLGDIKIRALDRFDAFICISNRVQKCVRDFRQGGPRLFTIPNGVDERFLYDEEANKEARGKVITRYRLADNAHIVSYVGSIEHRKGIDVLARAWPRIVSDLSQSRLFLVGPFLDESPFCQRLRALLGNHLGKTAFLVGKISDPALYYRASDVFV